jgi:hypothetical protein
LKAKKMPGPRSADRAIITKKQGIKMKNDQRNHLSFILGISSILGERLMKIVSERLEGVAPPAIELLKICLDAGWPLEAAAGEINKMHDGEEIIIVNFKTVVLFDGQTTQLLGVREDCGGLDKAIPSDSEWKSVFPGFGFELMAMAKGDHRARVGGLLSTAAPNQTALDRAMLFFNEYN